jgi:hypothetical protein
MEQKLPRIPMHPSPLTLTGSPTISIPHLSGPFVTVNDPTWAHHGHQSPQSTCGPPLGLNVLWVWTNIVRHPSTIHRFITVSLPPEPPVLHLVIPPSQPGISSLPPQPFLEHHGDRLLSLSDMQLNFPMD